MTKPLKLFNGGDSGLAKLIGRSPYRDVRASIAAHSRADAARMVEELTSISASSFARTMKIYWSECWGNTMREVTPERGIWLEVRGKLWRVYPPEKATAPVD